MKRNIVCTCSIDWNLQAARFQSQEESSLEARSKLERFVKNVDGSKNFTISDGRCRVLPFRSHCVIGGLLAKVRYYMRNFVFLE